jgi:cell division protein YceG involved in septum cleavage
MLPKLVIKKLSTKQDFIHLISQNLEADSLVLQHMFRDTVFLAQYGLDTHTALSAVMPNTYQVQGLPPGPICTPSEQSINAVLHAAQTNYIYFCAKEDFSGRHNFAASLMEHNQNATKYHDALNARNIR